MEIGGYGFNGVVEDPIQVSEHQVGVYVVLSLRDGEPNSVIDVGTTGEGSGPSVTPTKNLQYRLRYHDRKGCWERHSDDKLGYCVKHVTDDERRLSIEEELRWKFDPPCGSDNWEEKRDEMREEFGPKGGVKGKL